MLVELQGKMVAVKSPLLTQVAQSQANQPLRAQFVDIIMRANFCTRSIWRHLAKMHLAKRKMALAQKKAEAQLRIKM